VSARSAVLLAVLTWYAVDNELGSINILDVDDDCT